LIPYRDRSDRLPRSETDMDRGAPQRVQRERAIGIVELDGAEVGQEDLGAEALRENFLRLLNRRDWRHKVMHHHSTRTSNPLTRPTIPEAHR